MTTIALPDVVNLTGNPEASLGFASAQLLPRRAMMLFQARARTPELGEFDVLASPSLEAGLARLDGGLQDHMGNGVFSMGGAFLAPFANRIRGRFDPARDVIVTRVAGQLVQLPANGVGHNANAERNAIHGLILNRAVDTFDVAKDQTSVVGHIAAGDFDGHWLSRIDLRLAISLIENRLVVDVRATNVGNESSPVGLGWHPYFALPSGRRDQARIRLPARQRLAVNNYDEVLPSGEIIDVIGTPYDFTPVGGMPLGSRYFDDCFVDLKRDSRGDVVCEVIDASAAYGMRITTRSPHVTALQLFAPPDKPFVVIEPQFNWADPFGDAWPSGTDTGMAMLEPRDSVDYRVELEIFTA